MTAGARHEGRREESDRKPGRRRDLDLMRTFVVVGLVFFHSARVFDTGDFYVKNEPRSELIDVVLAFASVWGMPLLFVISGMGIRYSLRKRSPGQFALERTRRLLVPLVFGMLVIVPPQVWTRLRGLPRYDESYWDFWLRFFDVEFALGDFPFIIQGAPGNNLYETGHLWFLVLLFAFTLVLVPILWLLQQPRGIGLVERLAGSADNLWILVLAGVPLALIDGLFGSEQGLGGWNRYSYAILIFYGYLLASERRLGKALQRHHRTTLIGGMITFIVVGAFLITSERDVSELLVASDGVSVAMRALKALSGWLWVTAILGFASRSQGRSAKPGGRASRSYKGRITAYLSVAVLPVYVLHQTVIVLLAFYLVEWPLPTLVKYVTLSLISLVIILLIYDLAVRRTRVTRFLFGMK